MQNLVSKNPIQRFKQGKKVVKALDGLKADFRYFLDNNGKVFQGHVNHLGASNNRTLTHRYQTSSGNYGSFDGGKTYYELNSGRPLSYKANAQLLTAINKGKFKNNSSSNFLNSDQNQRLLESMSQQTTSGPKRPLKTKEQWASDYNSAINELTPQQLMYLDSLGIGGKDAQSMQQSINDYYTKNNINATQLATDNKWGKNSKAALTKILSSMPTNYRNADMQQGLDNEKNIPETILTPTPKIEMPYTSTGTYDMDKSKTLKNFGIRDYNSLLSYVNENPGNSIASDLKQRFGETSEWNQQNIENEIGIGGHYGRMNRNALWGYLAGLKNKYNQDYARKLGMMMLGYNKQGGQLVSRNPIQRFKNKKK